MTQPSHQLGQCGTGLSGQHGTRMAKIMQPQIRPTSCSPGPIPVGEERGTVKVATARSREQQTVLAPDGERRQMITNNGCQMRRQAHHPNTCNRLRRTDNYGATHPDRGPTDCDLAGFQIDIGAAQLNQLPEPQSTPG